MHNMTAKTCFKLQPVFLIQNLKIIALKSDDLWKSYHLSVFLIQLFDIEVSLKEM